MKTINDCDINVNIIDRQHNMLDDNNNRPLLLVHNVCPWCSKYDIYQFNLTKYIIFNIG